MFPVFKKFLNNFEKSTIEKGEKRPFDLVYASAAAVISIILTFFVFLFTEPDRKFSFSGNFSVTGYLFPAVFCLISICLIVRFFLFLKLKKKRPDIFCFFRNVQQPQTEQTKDKNYCVYCAATLLNDTNTCAACGKYNDKK